MGDENKVVYLASDVLGCFFLSVKSNDRTERRSRNLKFHNHTLTDVTRTLQVTVLLSNSRSVEHNCQLQYCFPILEM